MGDNRSFWAIALSVILLLQVVSFGNFSDFNFIQEADAKKPKIPKDKDSKPEKLKLQRAEKTKDPPRISTRGHFTDPAGGLPQLIPPHTATDFSVEGGTIPGFMNNEECPKELVIYVHGF